MSQEEIVAYPQDRKTAGPHYWATLFNSAARLPEHPSKRQQSKISNYINDTVENFVCDNCVESSIEYIKNNPITTESKGKLLKWLCGLKNNSNDKEGKAKVDCDEFISKSVKTVDCKTCAVSVSPAPVPEKEAPKPVIYNPNQGFSYTQSISNFLDNYPIIKKAMGLTDSAGFQTQHSQSYLATQAPPPQHVQPNGMIVTAVQPAQQQMNQMQELAQKYPTLAGIDLNIDSSPRQEELDGVLKSLDSIYIIPAQAVGIPPAQMNLAYTPEMLSNGISLITQMYLTNTGSMITTLSSSLILIAVSIFAKNSIANYDRLFMQNVAGSLLFHTVNFLNPRAKDELIPDLKKLMAGAMKGDMAKVKESLLYKSKEENSAADKHAAHLLNLIKSKKGIIDMKALSANHKDLRSGGAHGMGSTGGTLTRQEYDSMMEEDGGPMLGDDTNYDSIMDADSEYGYMLSNTGI